MIKYCDLIDNMQILVAYTPIDPIPYLTKKKDLLQQMDAGNTGIREHALQLIEHLRAEGSVR